MAAFCLVLLEFDFAERAERESNGVNGKSGVNGANMLNGILLSLIMPDALLQHRRSIFWF